MILGILAMLAGAICGYLVLSIPHDDHVGTKLREEDMARRLAALEAAEAKGLQPGDEEYDQIAATVQSGAESQAHLLSLERENDDQKTLIATAGVGAGGLGLVLFAIGLVLYLRKPSQRIGAHAPVAAHSRHAV